MSKSKTPTKAQRKREREFCDLVAAGLLKLGAKQVAQESESEIFGYSSGEFEIETRAGKLTLTPRGNSVFGRFAETDRATILAGTSPNGKWNNHYFESVSPDKAQAFLRTLGSFLNGPKVVVTPPTPLPAPRADVVAAVRRAIPDIGPAVTTPKGLIFFEVGHKPFRIGQNVAVSKYGISYNPAPNGAGVATTLVAFGDYYAVPSQETADQQGVTGISMKQYKAVIADLNDKARKADRALRRTEQKGKNVPAVLAPPPARKLRDQGPVLAHKGCPPRCGKFHSLNEHEKEKR